MTIACKHVIDTEELFALNESLVSVLLCIDSRIQNLEGILFLLSIISLELMTVGVFKQTHIDVQARLGNFAFGIVRSYIFHTYCVTYHFHLSCSSNFHMATSSAYPFRTPSGPGWTKMRPTPSTRRRLLCLP
jgi:hypothetical protein